MKKINSVNRIIFIDNVPDMTRYFFCTNFNGGDICLILQLKL